MQMTNYKSTENTKVENGNNDCKQKRTKENRMN